MDDIRITEIDVETASETELRRLNTFINTLNAEAWPDDAPRPFKEFKLQLETTPPFQRSFRWLALRHDEPVGYARGGFREGDDNQHIIGGYVGVLPEERRRGLGTALLHRVLEMARREAKRLIFLDGDSFVPASNAFLERLGGRHGITEAINNLALIDLDHAQMRSWIEQGEASAGDYVLLDWRNEIPEEHFDRFVDLLHVMNTAPTEDLDIEDFVLTPEQLRHYEAARVARGQQRWTRVAQHRASGDFAGYTELFSDPADPAILYQGDTAVYPAHRGHGLGRWLKAANILGVLDDTPDATSVRTGNAGSNEHMLAINHAMGFKLYKTITSWQLDVEALEERLGGGGE